MHIHDIFVLTPPRQPSLAVAACRAGAVGWLGLDGVGQAGLAELDRHAREPYGVWLDGEASVDLEGYPAGRLARVAVSADAIDSRKVTDWQSQGRKVYAWAVDLGGANAARDAGVDGIILKGQEAGGRVGELTSYILLQRWMHAAGEDAPPVWVWGGAGLHTTAACVLAGAKGVVLDSQLLLTRESPLGEEERQALAGFDGSQTHVFGTSLGHAVRVYHRPGWACSEELAREEQRLLDSDQPAAEKHVAWREVVDQLLRKCDRQRLWPLGQDAASAKAWADRFGTVGGVIQALARECEEHLAAASSAGPLAEGSPFAKGHNTRLPIVQGPMTRVSDTAPFAASVAGGGALPFLALALLRKADTEKLLRETSERVGDKAWGVGILGFTPPEVRAEQMAAIRQYKPPFALIAGGRPDQAKELESLGTPTYLHVPSPGLLTRFLKDGAKRFVFEGRECGGHVGPRSSFILWEAMVDGLLEHVGPGGKGDGLSVIFAGGIHDARSAAMAAALSAKLAALGVQVGFLMGTAYLFTREAVEGGAIVESFQRQAIACGDTVLLETGPGHAIRCVPTPYYDHFEAEKQRLRREGKSKDEITQSLEWMNMGRLRVASKGVERVRTDAGKSELTEVPADSQRERGMYMIGQVAAMHDRVVTIDELHRDVSEGGGRLLNEGSPRIRVVEEEYPPACDVAIVGMSCYYPQASGVDEYWQNILDKVNAVDVVPDTHWDWRLYYDADPRAKDKSVSKWGGFLKDIPFDPLQYGITPNSLKSIEPLQLYLLEAVRFAIKDAGYTNRPFNREKTAAILGIGGGGSPVAVAYGFRSCLPMIDNVPGVPVKSQQVLDVAEPLLPKWTEDSFPGFLMNVAVGRVSNRFNFAGPNYAIDAACGSSLAALYACVRELQTGSSDVAFALGADTVQTPYAFVAFSKTHALSPRGRCRPFDAAADGIALSEGIGAVMVKRLADAERDGDKIYAVIKGVGSSSDGRDKGLTAPRPEGQLRALRRAYGQARVSPAWVNLVEAHGTGTVVGDRTEATSLAQVMREAGASPQQCALGSVKSMIGHSKCAAGIAGLIKAAKALHHKVLPPTLVETPNPKGGFDTGPLYLNTDARPWVHGGGRPRYAGVSAFGFGGTNFHTVLEEYRGDYLNRPEGYAKTWPAELMLWRGPRADLLKSVKELRASLKKASPDLAALSAGLWRRLGDGGSTLAIVAQSADDLAVKLDKAAEVLDGGQSTFAGPEGVYFAEKADGGRVAFLFPGQGSQYPNMLAQQAMAFSPVRESLDRADSVLADAHDRPLGKFIYPSSWFAPEQEKAARQALTQTDVAQPAIGAASFGVFRLLTDLGLTPDFVAGHSYGEFTALAAAGVIGEDDLYRLSLARGRAIKAATSAESGTMAALECDAGRAERLIASVTGPTVANRNSPKQTVVSGTEAAIAQVLKVCEQAGVRGQKIPVACAFHSELVEPARGPLAEAIRSVVFGEANVPVYANGTANPHPDDPAAVADAMADHLTSPVYFQDEVENLYDAGATLFVECGPGNVLTGLVDQTLAGKPHAAVAADVKGRPGLLQLLHLLGRAAVHGVDLKLDALFKTRAVEALDPRGVGEDAGPAYTPTTWILNSVRNRPHAAEEPPVLGQKLPESHPLVKKAKDKPAPAPSEPTMPQHEPHRLNGHPNGHHAAPASPAPESGDDAVMLGFQELMAKFLDTQKSVMSAYFGGAPAAEPAPPLPVATPPMNGVHANGHHLPPPTPAATPEPAPQPESEPVAEEEASQGFDRGRVERQLLGMVSERTGYPPEMLGPDMDLEGDLGIDSIKRVEILGELAEMIGAGGDDADAGELEMERLTTIKTLRGILDYLEEVLAGGGTQTSEKPAAAADDALASPQLEVQRALVRLTDVPLPVRPSPVLPSGVVIVTDDGRGVAEAFVGRLADFGPRCVLLRHDAAHANGSGDVFYADLTSPEQVESAVKRIRNEHGPVAGLVHLLPFADGDDRLRAWRDVKSLYLLLRELGEELARGGKEGGAAVLAATALGGGLGYSDGLPDGYAAGHGGVIGLLKCVGLELPDVLVRAVDFDPQAVPADEVAARLVGELGDADGPFEVGHLGDRRVTWEPFAAPLDAVETFDALDADSVVLITGGARGITAKVAEEFARRYGGTMILAGRSPLPDDEEGEETALLNEPGQIKAALIEQFKQAGREVAPAAVESAYQRLMRDREIRGNLRAVRDAGGAAEYAAVDVRDPAALGGLIDDIREKHGRLDGVVHGAGVIEDKLLKDKTPESFDRVFGTKVDSAFTLAKKLDGESLKFCLFFASVASRYGNAGQSDYAAANEVLSKLAVELDAKWAARVASVAWGPWSSVGMVADLEKHLVRKGLKLIDPAEGPRFVVEEIENGRKGEAEVIVAGGAENVSRPARNSRAVAEAV